MASSFLDQPVTGGAAPILLVKPSEKKQIVKVTCGFGAAVVRLSTTNASGENPANWFRLPNAQVFPWELDENEPLFVWSDITTTVSRAVKDVP